MKTAFELAASQRYRTCRPRLDPVRTGRHASIIGRHGFSSPCSRSRRSSRVSTWPGRTRPPCSGACMPARGRKPERCRSSSSSARFWSIFAMMAFSAYDHRMGWSHGAGRGCACSAMSWWRPDSASPCWWSSRTVTRPPPSRWRRARQWPPSGLYKFVRHPMYVGERDHDGRHAAGARAPTGGFSSSSRACWRSSSASSTRRSCSPRNWPGTANTRSTCATGWCPMCGSCRARCALGYRRGPKPGTCPGPAVATPRRSSVRAGPDSRHRQTPDTVTDPPADIIIERDVDVPTRDGTVLRINVFRKADDIAAAGHPEHPSLRQGQSADAAGQEVDVLGAIPRAAPAGTGDASRP